MAVGESGPAFPPAGSPQIQGQKDFSGTREDTGEQGTAAGPPAQDDHGGSYPYQYWTGEPQLNGGPSGQEYGTSGAGGYGQSGYTARSAYGAGPGYERGYQGANGYGQSGYTARSAYRAGPGYERGYQGANGYGQSGYTARSAYRAASGYESEYAAAADNEYDLASPASGPQAPEGTYGPALRNGAAYDSQPAASSGLYPSYESSSYGSSSYATPVAPFTPPATASASAAPEFAPAYAAPGFALYAPVQPVARSAGAAPPARRTADADGSVSRFLTGILPERAPVSARISLLVQVTRTDFPGSARLKQFDVPPGGATVTVTVSAPGLIPLGDLEQDLAVPSASDSEPVRFGFMAGRQGLHSVTVRAFVGGTCVGELALQVSVESGAALEEGRPQTAAMAGLAAEPGEVTLQVSRTAGGGYSFQLLSEALYPMVLIDRLAGDPARVVAKIAAELKAMASGRSPYATAVHARHRLRALGTELWADVVPEAVRRQFWAQRGRIELFTIASDMDTVPWELIYPVDLDNEDGFLVEQFPVVRRVYGQGRTRSLRLDSGAAYVVPPRSPADALDEVTALRGILALDAADRGVQESLDEVFGLLESMPSVLHFAGHNAFTDEAGSVISLNGGPLRPDDLAYARQKRAFAAVSPLVFLNGCRTAGEIAGFAQMNGWADKFMGAGAGAFIGSLWAVRSSSAKLFAEEFYRSLVQHGQTLGASSMRARQAIAADTGDPTWLAYTVYGNPSAQIDRPTAPFPER